MTTNTKSWNVPLSLVPFILCITFNNLNSGELLLALRFCPFKLASLVCMPAGVWWRQAEDPRLLNQKQQRTPSTQGRLCTPPPQVPRVPRGTPSAGHMLSTQRTMANTKLEKSTVSQEAQSKPEGPTQP